MINRKFKKCLITGITGSGGSYLAEHILAKDNKDIFFRTSIARIKIVSSQEVTLKEDIEDAYRDGPFSGYYFRKLTLIA